MPPVQAGGLFRLPVPEDPRSRNNPRRVITHHSSRRLPRAVIMLPGSSNNSLRRAIRSKCPSKAAMPNGRSSPRDIRSSRLRRDIVLHSRSRDISRPCSHSRHRGTTLPGSNSSLRNRAITPRGSSRLRRVIIPDSRDRPSPTPSPSRPGRRRSP